MIIRKLSEGIRRQDWFTVIVEVVIVVVGVYVGIYIGDIAKEREVQRDVNTALSVLQGQLKSDLIKLDNVIETQGKSKESIEKLLNMLGQSEIDLEELDDVLLDSIKDNPTYFPNRSAYQSMRDLGYLAKIKDKALSLTLSTFYESTLLRQDNAAEALDTQNRIVQLETRDDHWDRYGHDFIGDKKIAAIKIRNGFRSYWGGVNYYIAIVKRLVRPELIESIEKIEIYLSLSDQPKKGTS